ncbi:MULTISPECIES: HAMP domain-containing sensor histidine kinase [unclassified Lysobacter]|uniref:sensor histidine kinase n=1 Tax=unclassified Lysobacter TaxID=2635362 RepID=UPI001C24D043|nr:HAMP domain-containing sensor histidine kinase [Lysobacter sp. MMG2]MBU8974826.1 HAMP domain-containing histidine kinase [Lysobacter sp. MMG2]
MSKTRSGLRRRILLALFGYVVVLSVAVVVHGFVVNEHAERLVWQTLLDSEMDHLLELRRQDPGYRWTNTRSIALYDGRDPRDVPAPLRGVAPGVYDEIILDGVERVALVRQVDGRPLILALDITDLEEREFDMGLTVVGSAVTLIALLGIAIAWSVNRLVRPLRDMAQAIAALRPDQSGQRIHASPSASSELVVIADALNDYLQRNDRFVERERVFIDSASHELRTPVAVIGGAAENALQQPHLPDAVRGQLMRIQRTTREVEQLVSLLLVLAKDPARLARSNDRVELDQLIPEIVEDHRHLTRDKDLRLDIVALPACEILAPLPIVQAAIGNLLRNAIEHSDRGRITIRLETPATVIIDDPGHGMTPEEIAQIYARVARGGGRDGGGIGLDLISRLCEHLGWKLDIASDEGRGTTTTLRMGN